MRSLIRKMIPSRALNAIRLWRDNFVIAKDRKVLEKFRKAHPKEKNNKCRLVFIVQRTEVFNSVRSIAETAGNDARFEVYFLPLPRCQNGRFELLWDTYDNVVTFCKKLGFGTVLEMANETRDTYFDLSKLNPDVIFLNVPYTRQYPKPYRIEQLAKIAKVCTIPYGYSMIESHLHLIYGDPVFMQNIDYIFAGSPLEFGFLKPKVALAERRGKRIVYNVGFPRFDLMNKSCAQKKCVLWLPRWTANVGLQASNEQSSFLEFKDSFLQFAKEHPDVRFVIRPHPLMFENYQSKGIMTKEEVDAYLEAIRTMENMSLDSDSDYLQALNGATVLLADFTSLLAEFYISEKPVVFTGDTTDFSAYDKPMLDTFYFAGRWEEVERTLNALLSGDDPKAAQRKQNVKDFLPETKQSVGRTILDILLNDFKEQS